MVIKKEDISTLVSGVFVRSPGAERVSAMEVWSRFVYVLCLRGESQIVHLCGAAST